MLRLVQSSLAAAQSVRTAASRRAGEKKKGPADKDGLGLTLKRANVATEDMHSTKFMGHAHRSVVTGEVFITYPGDRLQDFAFADLWTRDAIFGTFDKLATDRFLFKVVPLKYRTWIYHENHRKGIMKTYSDTNDNEYAQIRAVLEAPCIDSEIGAGRISSIPAIAIACLATPLTGDILFTLILSLALLIVAGIGMLLNEPRLYRYTRFFTFPLRAGVVCVIFAIVAGSRGLSLVAGWFSVCVLIMDSMYYDISLLYYYGMTCTYEVMRVLPNRVFVCRRTGGGYEDEDHYHLNTTPVVHEDVSGFAEWYSSMAILADVMGMIVELKPTSPEEWESLSVAMRSADPIPFFAVNCFNAACMSGGEYLRQQAESELIRKSAGFALPEGASTAVGVGVPLPPDMPPPIMPLNVPGM